MTGKETPRPPNTGLEERGGYQGTHDPGQPSGLMQPQVNQVGQAPAKGGGEASGAASVKGSASGPDQGTGGN